MLDGRQDTVRSINNMKRLIRYFIVLCFAVLSGCVSTSSTQSYRPADHSGPAYNIAATRNEFGGGLNGTFAVLIDGQKVIDEKLPLEADGVEFYGQFDGHKVAATYLESVTQIGTVAMIKRRAIVFIDGERAATLEM